MESGESRACKGAANVVRRGLLLLCCIALSACAHEGQVFDKGTKKPLVGAFVIRERMGSALIGFAETHSRCYSAEVTQTDAEGRFQFPLSLNPFNVVRGVSIYAYAPDHQVHAQMGGDMPIVLEARQGSKSEKFKMVMASSLGAYCEGRDDDKSFIPVRKAQALELQSLAQTPEELRLVAGALYGIDYSEFGEKAAIELERNRASKREPLAPSNSKP